MPVADADLAGAASLPYNTTLADLKAPSTLLGRLFIFAAMLMLQYVAIVLVPHPWCTLHRVVAGAIVFLGVFLFIARTSLAFQPESLPLNRRLLTLYAVSLLIIAAVHAALLTVLVGSSLAVAIWFTAIPLSAVTLFYALIPTPVIAILWRRTRLAVLYATLAAGLIVAISDRVQAVWDAPQSAASLFLQRTTFQVVDHSLRLVYPTVHADPATFTISLPRFDVTIAGSCSGIEGLSLTLILCIGWLWYARRELRLARAMLLVPCALALIWTLNIIRIDALLALANAGYPEIAAHGFHSDAGWIAFNFVALTFLALANRWQWLARNPATRATHVDAPNMAATYLLPFLAILTAGLVSKAASSGFEWAYPLRFIAAAAVLWHFRATYRRMDWTVTWLAPATGALVFAVWIAFSRWTASSATNEIGATLATMPPAARLTWLSLRVMAAVVTVPIAEELAFRGFLLRRIIATDIDSVAYPSVTPLAIAISSAAFGMMHGQQWLAGIAAGVAYALLTKRTGRLADAIAAHATTNLLLAAWVLSRSDWGLW